MGGFLVRIPLSVFWPRCSSKVVYKINKSASVHPSQIVYKNNSIPRRLSNASENFGGNNLKKGNQELLVTESRICYELKEISSSPNTENRILWEIIDSVEMTVYLPKEKVEWISRRFQAALAYFGKIRRDKKHTHNPGGKGNMRILFSQSDRTNCRIPTRDSIYQDRPGFQGNKKFVKLMTIKQANASEIDTDFRTSGCGSVCIQVVPPDPKVQKQATRSTCIDGGCISNKRTHLKSYTFPPFPLIGRALAK